MVARVQREPDALVVIFHHDGESTETYLARDGMQAWSQALNVIAKQRYPLSGDSLSGAPTLPRSDFNGPSRRFHGMDPGPHW